MNRGDFVNSSAALSRADCSVPFFESRPSRSSFMFTREREQSMRSASCAELISSEKISTGAGSALPFFGRAAASAMFTARSPTRSSATLMMSPA